MDEQTTEDSLWPHSHRLSMAERKGRQLGGNGRVITIPHQGTKLILIIIIMHCFQFAKDKLKAIHINLKIHGIVPVVYRNNSFYLSLSLSIDLSLSMSIYIYILHTHTRTKSLIIPEYELQAYNTWFTEKFYVI